MLLVLFLILFFASIGSNKKWWRKRTVPSSSKLNWIFIHFSAFNTLMLRLLMEIFTHSHFSFNLCLRENETFEDDKEPSRTTDGCGEWLQFRIIMWDDRKDHLELAASNISIWWHTHSHQLSQRSCVGRYDNCLRPPEAKLMTKNEKRMLSTPRVAWMRSSHSHVSSEIIRFNCLAVSCCGYPSKETKFN